MKKKISRGFIAIALFSIFVTAFVIAVIFYNQLKEQVFSDLKVYTELLAEDMDNIMKEEWSVPGDIRVTVIDAKGNVHFDSAANPQNMENHLGRPEIEAAFTEGNGWAVRWSDTLSKSILYYALRMEGGAVLRVGKESASVLWVMLSGLPAVCVMIFLLMAVCMAASHYLTMDIVKPIYTMAEDIDHINESEIYAELVPFTRKIRSQHEEILSAANMRRDFTANVSHELKTPLAAISGYAELMETGVAKEEDVRHFSTEIRKSAGRLLALINDILKLSKLDAGNQDEFLEIVDFAAVVKDTVSMLSVQAEKLGVSVRLKKCETAKIRIGQEPAEEIAYNLIENAIRYNQKGGEVFVSVYSTDKGAQFEVSDTGIGIAGEHQERIFERFYRVDKSRSKELGGTGLGLAIVKHICDLTEGEIKLESRPGKGTTVLIIWKHQVV